MPQIGQATAEAVQKSPEGLTTSQFRFGLGQEVPVDLTPCQDRVNRILKFKAENAVRKQKDYEAGSAKGKPPTEMDQTAAQLWAALKEGKSLNDLSPAEVAQAYFILREIDQKGQSGDFFQDAAKDIKDPKEKQRVKDVESEELKKTIEDFERKLVGRNYPGYQEQLRNFGHWAWQLGSKRPGAREILILDELIKDNGGNVEKAAAIFASEQIEAVLRERGEGVKEAVGIDKVDAAKNSTDQSHRRIAGAIERSTDLTEKALKKRKEVNRWTTADEYRKFIGSQLTETDLTDAEIILVIANSNPDTGVKISGRTIKGNASLDKWLKSPPPKTTAQIKTAADQMVVALRTRHSLNSVTDTAFDILGQLGDKLPETAAVPTKKIELTAEVGRTAKDADFVLALASGMSEADLDKKGFDKTKREAIRRKYFNRDAAGNYVLKQVDSDGNVDADQQAQKAAVRGRHNTDVEKEIDKLAGENAKVDLTSLQRGTLGGLNQEPEMVRIATAMGLTIKIGRVTRTPNSLAEINTIGKMSAVQSEWVKDRVRSTYSGGVWRGAAATVDEATTRYINTNDAVGAEYHYAVTKIKAKDIADLGPETAAVLKTKNKLQDPGNLVNAALPTPADMTNLIDGYGTPTAKLKDSPTLAQAMVQRKVPLSMLALLISFGSMTSQSVFAELTAAGRDKDEGDLRRMLSL